MVSTQGIRGTAHTDCLSEILTLDDLFDVDFNFGDIESFAFIPIIVF